MRISDWSSDVCSSDLTCPNMNSPKQKCQGESRGRAASGAAVHLERLDEGRLRNLDLAELAHPLLAFLLLLQQLALARDVAAVALRGHVDRKSTRLNSSH